MDNQKKAPPEVLNVVKFLRNSSGMKLKTGILNGKRVDTFKGRSAIKAILSPGYAKLNNVPQPRPTDEKEATALLLNILRFTFYLRVDRGAKVVAQPASSASAATSPPVKTRIVTINQMQLFAPEHYYVWLFEGSQIRTLLGGIALVAIMLAGVMFPLWPTSLRIGVWYLSIGVLGLVGAFFGLAIVRLIFFIITYVLVRPGIWIFPNLFADAGFFESFVPAWEWNIPPPKKKGKKKRKVEGEKLTKKSRGTPSPAPAPNGSPPPSQEPASEPKIVELDE